VLGVALTLSGTAALCACAALGTFAASGFALSIAPLGCFFQLMSLSPAQPTSICIAWAAVCASSVSIGSIFAFLLSLEVRGARGNGGCVHPLLGHQPCWLHYVQIAWSSSFVLVCAIVPTVGLVLFCRRERTARMLMDALSWTLGSVFLVLSATTFTAVGAAAACQSLARKLGMLYWEGWSLFGAVLALTGVALFLPGIRSRVQHLFARRSEALVAAAGVAALLGNCSPAELLRLGEQLFRAVRLDLLAEAHLADPTPDPSLFELSEPVLFHECDAMISHSWCAAPAASERGPPLADCSAAARPARVPLPRRSDDPRAKWVELQAWREAFRCVHGREPKVWLDKICLRQDRMDDNLACLPLLLAGCNTIVALAGRTYLRRLWCTRTRPTLERGTAAPGAGATLAS
jgi:hypothetical protein